MKKYAIIIDDETKQCVVGDSTDIEYYKSLGMEEMDVEQDYNGCWYVEGYAPVKPAPTKEEQSAKRETAYVDEVDPITCHINRLKDEEQTPEIEQEIEELKQERSAQVEEIKERFPYPTEE